MEKKIEEILAESGYDRNIHETAYKVLQEVKSHSITYGEVKKVLNNLSLHLIYKNAEKERYSYLLSVIKNLLEEINNVRLTNSCL